MGISTCFVYPYATFGGVERVMLNRGLAFRRYAPDVHADLHFLCDAGGLDPLRRAIDRFGLGDQMGIAGSLAGHYDFVSLIDCPEMIRHCEANAIPYIMECHTQYTENRRYLSLLRPSCRGVVTPSEAFGTIVAKEVPDYLRGVVSRLSNFVPWDLDVAVPVVSPALPEWRGRPVLFLARMDRLKEPASLLDAASLLDYKRPGEFVFVFCGMRAHDLDMDEQVRNRGLDSCTVLLPPVPFHSTQILLRSVALAGGLFVSTSRAESFGLSAAEAICASLPVLLSDIDPHLSMVDGYEEVFTYPLGDAAGLARGIERLVDDYDAALGLLPAIRERFSTRTFIGDWKRLVATL